MMFAAICITCLMNDRRAAQAALSLPALQTLERWHTADVADKAARPRFPVLRSEEPGTVSTCHVQTVRLSSVGMIPSLHHAHTSAALHPTPLMHGGISSMGLHICSCDSGPAQATAYIYLTYEPLHALMIPQASAAGVYHSR